ncbi:hypothetical protein EI555_007690, partial [Monodon monoceros]
TDLNTNTSITHSIYWVNKFTKTPTTFIYTHHTTLNAFRSSNPSMSRNCNDWFFPQNKSILGLFSTTRTPVPLIPVLVIFETMSLFSQPIALAIRLTASIRAGALPALLITSGLVIGFQFNSVLLLAPGLLILNITADADHPRHLPSKPTRRTTSQHLSPISLRGTHHLSLPQPHRRKPNTYAPSPFYDNCVACLLHTSTSLRIVRNVFYNLDGVYGSTFFMATGFHGRHGMIDSTFLIVCFLHQLKFHFTSNHHLDFAA